MSAAVGVPATLATAATHPDPYPFYANLTARAPFGRDGDDGPWVAASADAVSEVLDHPDCVVRPPNEPVPAMLVGSPAGAVFGRLVRMTEGADQARRKRTLAGALRAVDTERIRAQAAAMTERATGWADVQFGVPVRLMGRLLGVTDPALTELPWLVGEFTRCIPPSAGPEDVAAASGAATRLGELLADGGAAIGSALREAAGDEPDEQAAAVANLLGLLSQTYDATAGLIGTTLLTLSAGTYPADTAMVIDEVARFDAPVQNTRRFTRSATRVAGQALPAGAEILVLLAAANRDPLANPDPHVFRADRPGRRVFTFGLARHRCPGRALATAITAGVADMARGARWQGHFRPSGNARIPILEERAQ